MDWWHSKRVEVKIPYNVNVASELATLSFDITCTPCQHFSGRKLWDDFQTLWSSWVVESNVSGSAVAESHNHRSKSVKVKVCFAGDTGYRAVRDGEDENAVPVCPAFKEIGDVFGGFDFAMIPIGLVSYINFLYQTSDVSSFSLRAYNPRTVMSPIHCAPQDSVRIFQDIRARKALGMHWGYDEPMLFITRMDVNLVVITK
jgi:N-acyl-phosphatidylethanolamine-hydrolysing phospholipase D